MDKFTFPCHKPPVPRPTTVSSTSSRATTESGNRDSNALRASVLDAALQLGLGSNSLVADWMFNNPVKEEDEEQISSPGLTHASSATSDDYFSLSPSFSHSPRAASSYEAPVQYPHLHSITTISNVPTTSAIKPMGMRGLAGTAIIGYNDTGLSSFPAPLVQTQSSSTHGKLRKKKRADGYESDVGHISDAWNKQEKMERERETKKKVELDFIAEQYSITDAKDRLKAAKSLAKEEKLLDKKEKEEERKRKKSQSAIIKSAKKAEEVHGRFSTGYETDGGISLAKVKKLARGKTLKAKGKTVLGAGEVGYETDAGYISSYNTKKTKASFFKLSIKSSRSDLPSLELTGLTPLKEKPFVPLPIAEQFSTSLDLPFMNSKLTNLHIDSTNSYSPQRSPLSSISPLTPSISFNDVKSSQPSTVDSSSRHSLASDLNRILPPTNHAGGVVTSITSSQTSQTFASATSSEPFNPPSSPGSAYGSSFSEPLHLIQNMKTRPRPMLETLNVSSPQFNTFFQSSSRSPNSPFIIVTHSKAPSPAPLPSALSHFSSTGASTRSQISSPNVLAYYDIPPQTPPPAGPLPNVPNMAQNFNSSATSTLRPRVINKAVTRETSLGVSTTMQRGRESPFPSRPIYNNAGIINSVDSSRYRYPVGQGTVDSTMNSQRPIPRDKSSHWFQDGDDEEDDLQDVLQRFDDSESEDHSDERALDSRRSFEAFQERYETSPASQYYGSNMVSEDDENTFGVGDRNSRWSGSIYSRASMLDPDKSEEARGRFLERVAAMLTEEQQNIPPVPKLPVEFQSAVKRDEGYGSRRI